MAHPSIPGDSSAPNASSAPVAPTLANDELPAALRAPTARVGVGFALMLCLANVALWLSMQPVSNLLIPLQVVALDVHHTIATAHEQSRSQSDLAFVLAIGVTISIFSNAIGGALSDRTTSRFGRRRPWLLICSLLSALTLGLLAAATNLWLLALGWALYQLFANGALAALVAVIPDRVPERQRGFVSALVGLSLPLALVLGSILVGIVFVALIPAFSTRIITSYLTLIAELLVVITLFTLILPDPALPKRYLAPFNLRRFLAGFWLSPRRYPDFGWAWLTRFLVILGYATGIGSFLLYFLKYGLRYEQLFPGHTAEEGTALAQIVTVVFILLSSVLGGILSDRFQRRKLFVIIATILIAVALALLSTYRLLPTNALWPMVLIAGAILGFGFGAYLAVDVALVTQVLPSASDRGKDMGVFNIANALPQAIAPVFGAAILNLTGNNYAVMFLIAAAVTLLGALLVQPIKGVR